jgi:hypothetical protein
METEGKEKKDKCERKCIRSKGIKLKLELILYPLRQYLARNKLSILEPA